MVARSVSWPDTSERLSPQGYGAEPIAFWLLGRHPHLAELLVRADCVVRKARRAVADYGDDGDHEDDIEPLPYEDWPWRPDLDALAYEMRVFDAWDRREEPGDVPPPPDAEHLAGMTDNEVCQLRLLAMLAVDGPQVGLGESGMYALEEDGRAVLADWLEALRLEWADPIWRITGPSH